MMRNILFADPIAKMYKLPIEIIIILVLCLLGVLYLAIFCLRCILDCKDDSDDEEVLIGNDFEDTENNTTQQEQMQRKRSENEPTTSRTHRAATRSGQTLQVNVTLLNVLVHDGPRNPDAQPLQPPAYDQQQPPPPYTSQATETQD